MLTMFHFKRINSYKLGMTLGIAGMLVLSLYEISMAANTPKRVLRGNMTEVYNVVPGDASNLFEMFKKGMWYGRARMNFFKWYWDEETKKHPINPTGFGIGGSLIYKTAPFYGISGTLGLYTSQQLGLLNSDDARYGKSGKDTFSRYKVCKSHDWGMTVLAQAYLQYHFLKTDIKSGRMIYESPFTKSNDTKMIPNTFQGVAVVSRYLPDTALNLAYFNREKLRDHTKFHDVITYNWGDSPKWYDKWNNQDDSAVHRGLSYKNLRRAGVHIHNTLFIAGVTNESIHHLRLDLWFAVVPDLFHTMLNEVNYAIPLGGGWTLTPGFRFMEQFDDGAGDIGGAALSGKLAGKRGSALGYHNADSVKARLYAGRIVLKKGAGKIHFGYTKVTDDADFISPWRGFPTGGYTRSMGTYNWLANTKSWMVEGAYDFGKAGLIKGFRAALDYTSMNYDDNKERLGSISKTDRHAIHLDAWYRLPVRQYVELKVRLKHVGATRRSNGSDPSYSDLRVELNYLF